MSIPLVDCSEPAVVAVAVPVAWSRASCASAHINTAKIEPMPTAKPSSTVATMKKAPRVRVRRALATAEGWGKRRRHDAHSFVVQLVVDTNVGPFASSLGWTPRTPDPRLTADFAAGLPHRPSRGERLSWFFAAGVRWSVDETHTPV